MGDHFEEDYSSDSDSSGVEYGAEESGQGNDGIGKDTGQRVLKRQRSGGSLARGFRPAQLRKMSLTGVDPMPALHSPMNGAEHNQSHHEATALDEIKFVHSDIEDSDTSEEGEVDGDGDGNNNVNGKIDGGERRLVPRLGSRPRLLSLVGVDVGADPMPALHSPAYVNQNQGLHSANALDEIHFVDSGEDSDTSEDERLEKNAPNATDGSAKNKLPRLSSRPRVLSMIVAEGADPMPAHHSPANIQSHHSSHLSSALDELHIHSDIHNKHGGNESDKDSTIADLEKRLSDSMQRNADLQQERDRILEMMSRTVDDQRQMKVMLSKLTRNTSLKRDTRLIVAQKLRKLREENTMLSRELAFTQANRERWRQRALRAEHLLIDKAQPREGSRKSKHSHIVV